MFLSKHAHSCFSREYPEIQRSSKMCVYVYVCVCVCVCVCVYVCMQIQHTCVDWCMRLYVWKLEVNSSCYYAKKSIFGCLISGVGSTHIRKVYVKANLWFQVTILYYR